MARSSERARIELLRATLAGADAEGRTLVGIGDDAAVLAPGNLPLVWTIDAQVEGVHFRRDLMTMSDLGFRATMAAASDLGAMGASPLGILAALVLPDDVEDDDLRAIAEGQREAADAIGTRIIGGNLARGRELSITTTALGESAKPLGRDGAVPGQTIALAGPLGLAAAGLSLIERGQEAHEDASDAVTAFRRPTARIASGLTARDVATAAIDISDGLVRDLSHIARASNVHITLDPTPLVTPALERAAALLGKTPLELALYGGEDYAIVVTVPEGRTPPGFTPIGRILAAAPGEALVRLSSPDGTSRPLKDEGFDHFS